MSQGHHVEHNTLTAAEISAVWQLYMQNTLALQVLKYFSQTTDDTDIKSTIDDNISFHIEQLDQTRMILDQVQHPIPDGFSDKDVNEKAPKLFTDTFALFYLHHMTSISMQEFVKSIPLLAELDVRDMFNEALNHTMDLANRTVNLLLEKGLFVRPPYIPVPEKVAYINKQNFLTGWFGNRRSLNTFEITSAFTNVQNNVIGRSLLLGFRQVTESEELKGYFHRGVEISAKHIEILSSILNEEHLPPAMTSDTAVTRSKVSPFSDKLMMYHIYSLVAAGIENYGYGIARSSRRDVSAHYSRLLMEIMQYGEDGANIMIDKAWMEQPPQAPDRDQLAQS
ncbi:DUF3231 family protein [Caldalkalibacillus salinus]|uniref:DUF3231 family protein n=1 Tax=Caldalkalibacillus salinus TaxID=2803787 RepID=UPI0019250037